jgi:hypothetical protein
MSKDKNAAREWLQSIIGLHTAKNIRNYSFHILAGEAAVSKLGFQVDLKPAEGKVVDQNEDWLCVKTASNKFFIAIKTLLSSVPEIGSTVRITPYHRRRFDGKEVGAPDESHDGFFTCQTFTLGDSNSRIPVDKKSLQSSFLLDLIGQIEKLPTPDGLRNLGNALVDAGGEKPAVLGFKDPSDDECCDVRPAIEFAIDTLKFKGSLVIEYNRGLDYYDIVLLQDGVEQKRVEDVDFMSLSGVVVDLVDDGMWKIAKVEILKAVKAKKAV